MPGGRARAIDAAEPLFSTGNGTWMHAKLGLNVEVGVSRTGHDARYFTHGNEDLNTRDDD